MGDLFQEHKKFIISLVVGALGFLVLWLIVGALYSGEIRRLKLAIQKAQGEKSRAVAIADLARVQQGARRADAAHAALIKAIRRVAPADFVLGENEPTPDLHYNRVREGIRGEELERCAIRNIDVDQDLGLPDVFPTTRREFEWYLRGLDVVKQVLDLVLEIDEKVQEGGIARIDKIEMQPAPKTRPGPGAAPYLGDHRVSFVIVGYPQAVVSVVESLARRRDDGRFLQVLSGVIRSLDAPPGVSAAGQKGVDPQDRERVEARLDLVAVDVNPEGRVARPGRTTP